MEQVSSLFHMTWRVELDSFNWVRFFNKIVLILRQNSTATLELYTIIYKFLEIFFSYRVFTSDKRVGVRFKVLMFLNFLWIRNLSSVTFSLKQQQFSFAMDLWHFCIQAIQMVVVVVVAYYWVNWIKNNANSLWEIIF